MWASGGLSFEPVPIPLLGDIPFLGPILFRQDPMVYLSFVLVPLLWFVLYRTVLGLNIRSVGESPRTADAMGISVYRTRYLCVALGGILSGLGGLYLSLAYTPMWMENMTAGRGWIAVALTIFALWDPSRALVGAYLFGGLSVLGFRLQTLGVAVPATILLMIPYAFTVLVLVITAKETIRKRIGAPAALGVPYVRES